VMEFHDCTSEYAMRLLDFVLTSEHITDEVFRDIDALIEQHKRKDDE